MTHPDKTDVDALVKRLNLGGDNTHDTATMYEAADVLAAQAAELANLRATAARAAARAAAWAAAGAAAWDAQRRIFMQWINEMEKEPTITAGRMT